MKRKSIFRTATAIVLLAGFAACNKNDDVLPPTSPEDANEYKFVRLLVSDETSTTLTFLQPAEATTASFRLNSR